MVDNEKKYKLGLALSGGGARGFAHAGALKALEDKGLKPEIISGTSAGALAAVLYADGYAPEEMIELFTGKPLKDFAAIHVPSVSVFDTKGIKQFLKKTLRKTKFEDLNIPIRVVATNLDEGKSRVFDSGPLIDAVTASCSIPIVFNPTKIEGNYYVDGGILKNFPVSVIRGECEKVIGVNVSPLVPKKYNQTIVNIAERTYHYMSRTNTFLDRTLCDVLIEIDDLTSYKTFDIKKANNIFKIGYEYGNRALAEYKK